MARKYAHFDHMTLDVADRAYWGGRLSQVEFEAFHFLHDAGHGKPCFGYPEDTLKVVREYLEELKTSGVPRLASVEDLILAALENHRPYNEEQPS